MRNAAGLLAGLDVLDFEVTASATTSIVSTPRMSRAGSAVCVSTAHVDDLVGYRLLDEHLVLRVDRDLRVVAHGAALSD